MVVFTKLWSFSDGVVDVSDSAMVVSVKDVVSTVLELFFFAEVVVNSVKVVVVSDGVVYVSDRAMVVSVNNVVVSTMLELSFFVLFCFVIFFR